MRLAFKLFDSEGVALGPVDTTTGLATFNTAPAMGVEITPDFDFDVPVRFDTEHMAVTWRPVSKPG